MAATESERVKRELPVKLTQVELLKLGDDMADVELEIGRRREDRKAINADIKELADKRRTLAEKIDSGEEKRLVLCTWIEDLPHNCKRLVRQDTGIEVDVKALTADDRQEDMFASSETPAGEERIDLDKVPDDDEDPEGDDEPEPATQQQATAPQHFDA